MNNATMQQYFMGGSFLDSPNTTSAITYACYYKAESGTAQLYAGGFTAPTITLMEIAG